MFTVAGLIKLLQVVGPIVARRDEFKSVWDTMVSTFKKPADQATLQQAYRELFLENTGGGARLDEMLRKAEQEG